MVCVAGRRGNEKSPGDEAGLFLDSNSKRVSDRAECIWQLS